MLDSLETLDDVRIERIHSTISALTKPSQLVIVRAAHQAPTQSPLTNPTQEETSFIHLLQSQARLTRNGYVEWSDGLSTILEFIGRDDARDDDGDQFARQTAAALIDQLRVNHATTRLLTVYVLDHLYQRSRKFRQAIQSDLHSVFQFALDITPQSAAPTTKKRPRSKVKDDETAAADASEVQSESVKLIRQWVVRYGRTNRLLRLGYKWVCDTLHIANDTSTDTANASDTVADKATRDAAMQSRFERLRREWLQQSPEIETTVASINTCLEIIAPDADEWIDYANRSDDAQQTIDNASANHDDEYDDVVWANDETTTQTTDNANEKKEAAVGEEQTNPATEDFDDFQWNDEFDDSSSQFPGVAPSAFDQRTHDVDLTFETDLSSLENDDNRDIFNTLRDHVNLIRSRYAKTVEQWTKIIDEYRPQQITTKTATDEQRITAERNRQQYTDIAKKVRSLAQRLHAALDACVKLSIRNAKAAANDQSKQIQIPTASTDGGSHSLPPVKSARTDAGFVGDLISRRKSAQKRMTKHKRTVTNNKRKAERTTIRNAYKALKQQQQNQRQNQDDDNDVVDDDS